jgi:phosphopantothenoylcysteine decarboxylase/phosphopantothenate--cysteine ligase
MKKILIGISGSIAAYKACDLVRLFVKNGYDVYTILTSNAEKLVTPMTFANISGNISATDMWYMENPDMRHISLKDNASLLIIAPATANIIAKCANGIADDLLSTTYLSVDCPVIIAPAMNPNMWKHTAVQDNVEILKKRGVKFIDPIDGQVACGDFGTGKMAEPEKIFEYASKKI